MLLAFFFVVGMIPIVTGMNTTDISNMGTGCSKLSDLLMVYACYRLPDKFPEIYNNSTLRMKPSTLKAVLVVVFLVLAGSSYVSLSSLTSGKFLGMGIFVVVAIVVMLLRHKYFQDQDVLKNKTNA